MYDLEALRQAIDIVKIPSRVRVARSSDLPSGLSLLLEIAAREPSAEEGARVATGQDIELLRQASTFFIEQVLLAPESNSYRILGCTSEATTAELRRNMAFLLRWLHPDLDAAADRAVFAARVTAAWGDLKTPDRRAAYDELLNAETAPRRRRRSRTAHLRRERTTNRMHYLATADRHAHRSPWRRLLLRLMKHR